MQPGRTLNCWNCPASGFIGVVEGNADLLVDGDLVASKNEGDPARTIKLLKDGRIFKNPCEAYLFNDHGPAAPRRCPLVAEEHVDCQWRTLLSVTAHAMIGDRYASTPSNLQHRFRRRPRLRFPPGTS
jgi:hypothetical protein